MPLPDPFIGLHKPVAAESDEDGNASPTHEHNHTILDDSPQDSEAVPLWDPFAGLQKPVAAGSDEERNSFPVEEDTIAKPHEVVASSGWGAVLEGVNRAFPSGAPNMRAAGERLLEQIEVVRDDNMTDTHNIVKADDRRETVSDTDDLAKLIASRPKRTPRAPRRGTIAGSISKEGPPPALLEQMGVKQSNEAIREIDMRSDPGTAIRDSTREQEEQEASHNRTKIALLDVHKRKQEVEQQLRRVQTEYKQALQDQAARQDMSGQNFQDLVAQVEEQEANHNNTKIALLKAHKEKYEAEKKLSRAVTEYRQKLQAVGIVAEDNAHPIWEVDLEGKQTRPLYNDFPNMTRESHVNLLLNRAKCKFMLADYQGMEEMAFGALAVAKGLNFKPLSARCNFIIGIAFYHNYRFEEAEHQFRLASECKDKYGISMECVEGWLDKCSDGIAGNPSADAQSPIRDKYPRDFDRAVEMRFRADMFFARATNVAGNPELMAVENAEDVEDGCPSQGYNEENEEIEETPDPRLKGPKEILSEGEQSLANLADELESMDIDSEEDFEDIEDELEDRQWQDCSDVVAETLDPRIKELLEKDDFGDFPSEDYDFKGLKIPDPRADGLKALPLIPEGEQSTPTIDPINSGPPQSQASLQAQDLVEKPSWIPIPRIQQYDAPSAAFAQLASDATATAITQPASRLRSSTFADPMPATSSYAPFDYVGGKLATRRDRAVTNVEQKAAKDSKPGGLAGPLSWLTKDMDNIPLIDTEAWVNRSSEKRRQEAAKDQWQKRPSTAFVLYRTAYANRVRSLHKGASHGLINSLASESWKIETPKIRDQYGAWAKLEGEKHRELFSENNAVDLRHGES